jgi:hypothetical protein
VKSITDDVVTQLSIPQQILLAVNTGFWLLLITNIVRINSTQSILTVMQLKICVKLQMAPKIVDVGGKSIKSSINGNCPAKE